MMTRPVILILLLLTMSVQVMADGKMYWNEKVPPKIPYQRALILFKDGTETLVLQSKYEIPKIESKASLGWVVPVPAEPQIASLPADTAQGVFMRLSMNSRPEVTRIVPIVIGWLLLLTAGLSILTISGWALSSVIPLPSWFMRKKKKLARLALYGLLICTVIGALFLPALNSARGVDLISEQSIGIYDVKVVKSTNSSDLIAWLNKNEFKFGKDDKIGFDSYISRGWCFVVANINPNQKLKESEIVAEGLAAPLILRFPNKEPVYPVVLTGTGDFDTEILIYLASTSKMTCGNRLKLRFADKLYNRFPFLLVAEAAEPKDFFKPEEFYDEKNLPYPYLCKFRDVLTPAMMTQDITFTPAADNTPYREHIYKW